MKMLKKRLTNLIDNDSLAKGKIAKVNSMVSFGYYVTLRGRRSGVC